MSSPRVRSALNILRRTPVEDTEQNLDAFAVLLDPDHAAIDELQQRMDCPFFKDDSVAVDEHANSSTSSSTNMNMNANMNPNTNANDRSKRYYIRSDHNRDGDSYRSPWSNEYYPPLPDDTAAAAFKPSEQLRTLEILANEVFDSYRQLYYGKEEAISSVYLWDKEKGSSSSSIHTGFGGCFLIKKAIKDNDENDKSRVQTGYWNSIHVVDVAMASGKAKYTLSTTIILSIDIAISTGGGDSSKDGGKNAIHIGGSLTKQVEKSFPFAIQSTTSNHDHITNIGGMIEDLEIEMRSNVDALYIQKTREVVDSIRCEKADGRRNRVMVGPGPIQNDLNAALMARLKKTNSDS